MKLEAKDILYRTLAILYRYAEEVAVLEYPRSMERRSIDLAVRLPGGKRLLVKVARDAAEIPKSEIQELIFLASVLDSAPIMIARDKDGVELVEGVAYEKSGVKVISPETLEGLLSGREPVYVFESRGSYKVRVNPVKRREKRLEKGFSLGDLAAALNTSRKAVYDYERGKLDPSIDRAEKLIKILGEEVVAPCDVFEATNLPEPKLLKPFDTKLEEETASRLVEAGFRVVHVKRTAIDIGGSINDAKVVFTVQGKRESVKTLYEKSVYMSKMADVLNINDKAVVVDDARTARELEKEDVTVITSNELAEFVKRLTKSNREQL